MSFGTLDDGSGKIEFVIFPRTFQTLKEPLAPDMVVLMKAKLDEREGEKQLIVEKITIPDESILNAIPESQKHEIFIPRKTNKETMQKIGQLLKSQPGKDRVVVLIPNGGENKRIILPYGVKWDRQLEKKIAKLLE